MVVCGGRGRFAALASSCTTTGAILIEGVAILALPLDSRHHWLDRVELNECGLVELCRRPVRRRVLRRRNAALTEATWALARRNLSSLSCRFACFKRTYAANLMARICALLRLWVMQPTCAGIIYGLVFGFESPAALKRGHSCAGRHD